MFVTTTCRNNSLIIGIWTETRHVTASIGPSSSIKAFIDWAQEVTDGLIGDAGKESDVVMVAHNGMCYGHVILVKTMLV